MAEQQLKVRNKMTQADQIRKYVIDTYILPARISGQKTVTVHSGTIHADMQLTDRMPNVCSSLDTQKFSTEAGVTLKKRSGPNQSSTVEWTFELT